MRLTLACQNAGYRIWAKLLNNTEGSYLYPNGKAKESSTSASHYPLCAIASNPPLKKHLDYIMVLLDNYQDKIESFILTSIDKFKFEHENPSSLGVYCCPWAGWLTTNFNLTKTLKETGDNCPDFQFVETDLLELDEWEEEYENDFPTFKISEQIIEFDHDLGDEKLNELIFSFLEPILLGIKESLRIPVLLQMLDSNYVKVF